jgi:hypothetical protein
MGSLPLHHAPRVNAAVIAQADCGFANGAQVDIQHQLVARMVNVNSGCALSPPIAEVCRFISFEALRARFEGAKELLQFLKPEFLDSISEGTELEEV